jgi:hypothetical protein
MPKVTPVSASPLPGLPQIGKLKQLKPLRRPALRLTGPRHLGLQADPEEKGGPGEPPEGFVTAHTSRTEWWVYWGLAKVLKDPRDPRQPPYVGGTQWVYQKAVDGGRVVGGQVVDFIYLGPKGKTIGIRVQTERYHIMTDAATQMADFFLKSSQRAVTQIVDIFDQHFLADPSGKAVCVVVANALKGIQTYSPIFSGTSQRIRGGIR